MRLLLKYSIFCGLGSFVTVTSNQRRRPPAKVKTTSGRKASIALSISTFSIRSEGKGIKTSSPRRLPSKHFSTTRSRKSKPVIVWIPLKHNLAARCHSVSTPPPPPEYQLHPPLLAVCRKWCALTSPFAARSRPSHPGHTHPHSNPRETELMCTKPPSLKAKGFSKCLPSVIFFIDLMR